MNMEELTFSKIQKGDTVFILERDRRSGYPIYDQAMVLKVGDSKPMQVPGREGFINNVELQLQDSISSITVYLPAQSFEGIYNGVYYTTNIKNVINELTLQKQQALNILNNRSKYEAIVSECDGILNSLNTVQSTSPAPEYSEFKQRMDNQEALLIKIAQELGMIAKPDITDGQKKD